MSADIVEISVSRRCGSKPAGAIVHRVGDLSINDVVVEAGIPVTSVARTLIDLAAVISRDDLEEALDHALTRRLVTVGWLRWRIDALRRPGRPGIAVIGALCDARTDGQAAPQSVLETRLLRLIVRAGLPPPERQLQIRDRGRLVARVDFAYPDVMLVIEADGFTWHGGRRRWQADLARRNALMRLGWRILHVTKDDLLDRPDAVAESIAAALRPTTSIR